MTAIFKSATDDSIKLGRTGHAGDGQADTVNHGGPDKAVCAYFDRHYPYWQEQFGRPLDYGAFGENWTLAEWSEHDLCIGDIIRAGEVTVQVSQPRVPCYKLGVRHQRPALTAEVQETGFSGFYFRVLEEGNIASGTSVELVERDPAGITIAEANRIMFRAKRDESAIQSLLVVSALADSWRETLTERLRKLQQDDQPQQA
ncbi:MOSC domain-containing protein [Paenibacillus sp. NEAU-GSW1]|nr:MOSC domain-containing protein [Paenibacillus sp. NEAU-GSW1]